jgi:serine/threonine-protein kinase
MRQQLNLIRIVGNVQTCHQHLLNQAKNVPHTHSLPSVTGLTPEAAAKVLAQFPLSVQPNSEEFSAKVPKGYVIDSNPPAGEKVKRDALIVVRVSKGIEQIALTSYIGKSSDQALNELQASGFSVVSTYGFSETQLAGEVISQKPAGGGTLKGF